MNWTCSICGKDTSNVEYDYLINTDHIICHLQLELKDNANMKIKNWNKINGIAYKGYCIGSPTIPSENLYRASIYNLNQGFSGLHEYTLYAKFDAVGDFALQICLDTQVKPIEETRILKQDIKNFRHVVDTFEKMIDNIEKEKNKAKPISGPTNFNMSISSSLSW